MNSRALALSVLLLVGIPGCTEDRALPTSRPLLTSGSCPDEEIVAAKGPDKGVETSEADVNGDGSEDLIFLAEAEGPSGCTDFLVVETDDATFSAPVQAEGGGALGLPSIDGAAEIDDRPGADIYVTVLAGASTAFLTVFSVAGGKLVSLDIEDPKRADPFFPTGGSVGHLEGSDCVAEGVVSVATAVPRGGRYVVERTDYRRSGDSFVPAEEIREREVLPASRLEEIPELARSPFGGC